MVKRKKVGLIYNKQAFLQGDTSWIFDSFSTESFGSSWQNFGYEIIFRLEEIHASERVIKELKEAFMEPFGLQRKQYNFEPTFWRVYWNRGPLRASAIKACESGLDEVAKKNDIKLILNGIIIQPRPMGYIQAYIEMSENH